MIVTARILELGRDKNLAYLLNWALFLIHNMRNKQLPGVFIYIYIYMSGISVLPARHDDDDDDDDIYACVLHSNLSLLHRELSPRKLGKEKKGLPERDNRHFVLIASYLNKIYLKNHIRVILILPYPSWWPTNYCGHWPTITPITLEIQKETIS